MQECEEMWSVLPRRERVVELHGLKIDRPLDAALLKEYDHWWHVGAVPDMMDINKIHAISVEWSREGHDPVLTTVLQPRVVDHARMAVSRCPITGGSWSQTRPRVLFLE